MPYMNYPCSNTAIPLPPKTRSPDATTQRMPSERFPLPQPNHRITTTPTTTIPNTNIRNTNNRLHYTTLERTRDKHCIPTNTAYPTQHSHYQHRTRRRPQHLRTPGIPYEPPHPRSTRNAKTRLDTNKPTQPNSTNISPILATYQT